MDTKKQESTTLTILPYWSNKQHCMDKGEFHYWLFGVIQGSYMGKTWFENQQWIFHKHDSELFLCPPTTSGTQQTGINYSYTSILI
jgi:hypothetical protein